MNNQLDSMVEVFTSMLSLKGYNGEFKLVGNSGDFESSGDLRTILKEYCMVAARVDELIRFSLHYVAGKRPKQGELTRMMVRYNSRTGFRIENVIKQNSTGSMKTAIEIKDNQQLPNSIFLNVPRVKPKGMRTFCFRGKNRRGV